MIRFGEADGTVVESDWETEISNIRPAQVPDPERRAQLQQNLRQLNPSLVAPGHGPCLRLK